MKLMSLATKLQIYTKFLTTTHVYYSLGWIPLARDYLWLEKIPKNFAWTHSNKDKGFLRVNWSLYYTPKDKEELRILVTKT